MLKNYKKKYIIKESNLKIISLAKKLWLNNIYMNIKKNCKLKNKFLGVFDVLHLVNKQIYNLKPSKK